MTPMVKTLANRMAEGMLRCAMAGTGHHVAVCFNQFGERAVSQRIVCFGELLLRLSAPGRERLLQSPRFDVAIGGAEANVAVMLARMGHDAAMVSTVADNALGEAAVGELRRHGVDTRQVRTAPGREGPLSRAMSTFVHART